ncbi:hypothetical protein SLEP1_g15901 [Rubroshorea leprosula]|uniref:Uncharacterized protein n=1 Tax=Rubroshorea leprosula TaxID=152421 RepID=A0AAV5IZG1_9ROSI|nr:hypothetical protein SLEP1_g15901 [Rubroshorea leprosula]
MALNGQEFSAIVNRIQADVRDRMVGFAKEKAYPILISIASIWGWSFSLQRLKF